MISENMGLHKIFILLAVSFLVLALCTIDVEAQFEEDEYDLSDQDFAAAEGTLSVAELIEGGYLDNGDALEEEIPISDSGYFEGDIRFPEGLNIWSYATPVDAADSPDAVDSAVHQHNIWKDGVIPYVLRSKFTAAQKRRIAEGILEYTKHTCIKWVPRRGQRHYVYIQKGSGCSSFVGNIGRTNGQPITFLDISNGCFRLATVVHEMMHAAGFFHEQSRTDRDNYVTILKNNIRGGEDNYNRNFKKYGLDRIQLLGTKYDCQSVMHYSERAFSKNGKRTIVPKRSSCRIKRGRSFSPTDIVDLNKLYKCGGKPPPPTPPPTGPIHWHKHNWAFNCDFTNEAANLKNVRMRGEDCGLSCVRTQGCTHFAWTPYQGGTCWMKKGRISKNNAVVSRKRGIVCGVV